MGVIPLVVKVGYRYIDRDYNFVDIIGKIDAKAYSADGGREYLSSGSAVGVDYSSLVKEVGTIDLSDKSEIGPMSDPVAVAGQHSTIQFSTPKSYLTTTDVQNIANYIDKIEQIVNRVGIGIEIKLEKLEDKN